MKFKKIALSIATVGLLTIPSVVNADEESDFSWLDRSTWGVQTSGELIGKLGGYIGDGIPNNPKNEAGKPKAADLFKSEVTAKLFLNQQVADETSWHAGLQFNHDDSQIDGYRTTRQDSQFDWLRELYVDTKSGENMSWRLGKQQVVWGKADGVKFLDVINPTDFRHWGQDSMDESRIPLWMINGEYAISDNSSLQVIYVLQTDVTNQIPGLFNVETGDQGQPFVPLGMDTMLGQENGFMGIGPDLGKVAGAFVTNFNWFLAGVAPGSAGGNAHILGGFEGMTVKNWSMLQSGQAEGSADDFLRNQVPLMMGGPTAYDTKADTVYGKNSLDPQGTDYYYSGNNVLAGAVSQAGATTNLFTGALDTAHPTSMFDYMGDTTFATFDTFVGIQTVYRRELNNIEAAKGNLGIKYAGTNDNIGLNYTFNYYYHYDNNPVIDVSWEANGKALVSDDTNVKDFVGPQGAYKTRTIGLKYADGSGDFDYTNGPATMVFTETQNRINTFGLSFDYAIDNPIAPIILRSEMVYDKDTLQPVVDLGKLAYGDIDNAFTVQRADFFNYVIGLDITVMTNLFVSFQFMDKWNLDYVNEKVLYDGNSQQYGKFTANPATMSMSNGFRPAEEHQIMYTFFLSKPFMESDALRVNNIFLLENEGGGFWDRFDFEYSYSDHVLLSAAVNVYGGDQYGVFGQFKTVSNGEVGFKYLF